MAEGVGHVLEPEVQAQRCLSDRSVAKVSGKVQPASAEVPRRQRLAPSLPQTEAETAHRNEALRRAYATGACMLSKIGAHFGIHYATISHIARQASGG